MVRSRTSWGLATKNQERVGCMNGMGSALLAVALEGWLPRQQDVLTRMVANGQLTEADAYEVAGVIALLLEKVRAGEITQHFAELVLRKLADDKHEAWRARREGRQT